jgi:subfamily B ATP-binding cassette protein MsbA
LIDGQEINQYDLSSWRSKIGYVGQEPYIFNHSIKNNILIGKPGAEDEEVIRAAKMANIHDFIITLPEGYDTVVGDRGARLSAGQKQRLAIARTIVREPELFIFDEATSALDGPSEKMIQQSIESLSRSKTVIVIAHRISTLENADIIYEIDSGGKTTLTDFESLLAKSWT